MKLKDYLLTQEEYDEYAREYEEWADSQAYWGYKRRPKTLDTTPEKVAQSKPEVFDLAQATIPQEAK